MIMNEVLLDTYTYHQAEAFAKLNNIDVAEVVKTSVLSFLGKFMRSKSVAVPQKYELPERLKKMRGILAGVEDKDDDRLSYLLEKYK